MHTQVCMEWVTCYFCVDGTLFPDPDTALLQRMRPARERRIVRELYPLARVQVHLSKSGNKIDLLTNPTEPVPYRAWFQIPIIRQNLRI